MCLTVFVNCLVKQFAISLGVDVMVLCSVFEGAQLDRPYMVFQKVCVVHVILVCL